MSTKLLDHPCLSSCWFCNECLPYPTHRRVAVGSTDWWTWISNIEGKPANRDRANYEKDKPVAKVAKSDPVPTATKVDPTNRPLALALKVARDIDMFTRHIIIVPINHNHNHWVLALLVNVGQVVREEKAEPPT